MTGDCGEDCFLTVKAVSVRIRDLRSGSMTGAGVSAATRPGLAIALMDSDRCLGRSECVRRGEVRGAAAGWGGG